MPPSLSSTSNWDLTPVLSILRQPICQSEVQPNLDSRYSDSTNLLSPSHKVAKHDVENPTFKAHPLKDANARSPNLGDFGSLWELLGSTRPAPASKVNEPLPQETRTPTKPIVILTQPSVTDTRPEKTVSTSGTLLKPTPALRITKTYDSPLHNKADVQPIIHQQQQHVRCSQISHEVSSSETNAEGESDGYLNVFDPPISKARDVLPMIPLPAGVEAKSGFLETPPSSFDEPYEFALHTTQHPPGPSTLRLQPLAYRTAADQRVGLLTKLMRNHPDYTELVIQAGRPKKSKKTDISSRPIHVFVDMSNIMVGFHDSMKISRNIPVKTRIRRLPLSFENFSTILERGRPVTKRVLVGSDRFAAINESEQLGYEANILDRVQKIKQLTPRQLKFRKHPRATPQDGGLGSETNDAPEERWVEQGVDEILHLKILESLVDADEPATIVLATGDAAEAEYSGGFMKMVERALQRGWRVELVSFAQVTSYAYRKKEFRSRWGSQFKIIVLDDYIEEVLDIERSSHLY